LGSFAAKLALQSGSVESQLMKLISEFSATVASDSHSHRSRGNRHNLEASTDRNTQRHDWEMRVVLEEAVEGFFLFFVEEGGAAFAFFMV
jgi:hypothetical protein